MTHLPLGRRMVRAGRGRERNKGMPMTRTYRLESNAHGHVIAIVCLPCDLRSTHVMDIAQKFCSCCGRYHTQPGIREWPRGRCPHAGHKDQQP